MSRKSSPLSPRVHFDELTKKHILFCLSYEFSSYLLNLRSWKLSKSFPQYRQDLVLTPNMKFSLALFHVKPTFCI